MEASSASCEYLSPAVLFKEVDRLLEQGSPCFAVTHPRHGRGESAMGARSECPRNAQLPRPQRHALLEPHVALFHPPAARRAPCRLRKVRSPVCGARVHPRLTRRGSTRALLASKRPVRRQRSALMANAARRLSMSVWHAEPIQEGAATPSAPRPRRRSQSLPTAAVAGKRQRKRGASALPLRSALAGAARADLACSPRTVPHPKPAQPRRWSLHPRFPIPHPPKEPPPLALVLKYAGRSSLVASASAPVPPVSAGTPAARTPTPATPSVSSAAPASASAVSSRATGE